MDLLSFFKKHIEGTGLKVGQSISEGGIVTVRICNAKTGAPIGSVSGLSTVQVGPENENHYKTMVLDAVRQAMKDPGAKA